ncbi:hypothetical protein HYC85_031025 [Camellia sinensis]|uniref:Uncharacterized protein n=1 Tax=Camellia sinensis TaxID=4442 RepID=A0A7J7FPV3_CAMSI|nr:hypothetical protein HYC85_031025 [Camellia sinensis]
MLSLWFLFYVSFHYVVYFVLFCFCFCFFFYQLKDFEKAVIFPLSDVCFGPCTDELTEVIKIANHERRMQGLEHLVLAIFFGKQESDCTGMAAQDDCTSLFLDEDKWDDELLKCLRNSNTECGVESFDDSDAFKSLLPEDCLNAAGRP